MKPRRRVGFRSTAFRNKSPSEIPINLFYVPFDSRASARLTPVSKTFFKESMGRIFLSNKWVYDDLHLHVDKPLKEFVLNSPHLVLKDSKGVERFVLGFSKPSKGVVVVSNLQRVRNEYLPYDSKHSEWRWSRHREGVMFKALRKETKLLPAEQLFSEFLFRFRKLIRANRLAVKLVVDPENKSHYEAVIGMFCNPTPVAPNTFILDLQKSRVKAVLEKP